MNDSKNGVARAASLIVAVSLLAKVVGFVREQVIASQFGATGMTDAYVAAWALPQMLSMLIGGSISLAIVPIFLGYLGRNENRQGWELLVVSFRWLLLILTLAAALAFTCAPLIIPLFVPDFPTSQMALTIVLLRTMMAGGIFFGLSSFITALLNARKRFGWPACGPIVMNLGTIGFTLLLADSLGIVGLGWAIVLGTLLQLVFLLHQLFMARIKILDQSVGWRHPGIGDVLVLAGPIVVSSLFGQVYTFFDKAFASGLNAGSIAALNYASKLTQLPLGVFVNALAIAIYPTLAEYASRDNLRSFSDSVGHGIRMLSLIMAPAAAGLFALCTPIVRLAFERGSFDQVATAMTAKAVACYSIGLLGVASIQILSRAFYSLRDSVTPVKVTVGAALTNVILDVVLVKRFGHGGLALANSIAMICSTGWLIWLLRRKTGHTLGLASSLPKIIGASLAMGVLVRFVYPAVVGFGQVIALGMAVGVGVLVYLGLVTLLRVEELSQLIFTVRRRLGRGRGEASEAASN